MRNITISTFLLLSFSISISNAKENKLERMKGCDTIFEGICSACLSGYTLSLTNECIYSFTDCNASSTETCTIKGCLIQQSGKCVQCVEYQSVVDGVCKWWSHKNKSYTFDLESTNLCSPNSPDKFANCEFCYFKKNDCDKCSQGKLFFQGSCYDACPDGSFQANATSCQLCEANCKTCSSKTGCDTFGEGIDPNGFCIYGLPDGPCKNPCPYTFISGAQCNSKCLNSYEIQGEIFPIIQADTDQIIICSSIENQSSEYCFQNIEHLNKLSVVEMKEDWENQVYVLTIVLDETPHFCYTFKLVGLGTYTVVNSYQDSQYSLPTTNKRKTTLIYRIPTDDFSKGFIETVANEFVLHLQVLWKGGVAKTFDIPMKQHVNNNLSSSKLYKSTPTTEAIDCTDCTFFTFKQITSKLELSCSTGQTCAQDLITAESNSLITFTQTVTDALFQQTVYPEALIYDFGKVADKTNQTVYFESNSYDNSEQGKISYTISTAGITSGKLTVRSYIQKNYRLLDSQGSEIEKHERQYSQNIIYINIKRPLSEQLKEWMFYGMIIVIIFFIFRKQNKTASKNEELFKTYEQIPKSVEIQMNE